MVSVFDKVENLKGKGENAGHQHFLLSPQCFHNAYSEGILHREIDAHPIQKHSKSFRWNENSFHSFRSFRSLKMLKTFQYPIHFAQFAPCFDRLIEALDWSKICFRLLKSYSYH